MNRILRRLENLERNGHIPPPQPERHRTSSEDLDALYSYMFEDGPRPPSHLTAEESAQLDLMYDHILEDQEREGRAC
jgi:hypothetical protein